jgi:hypothetical protein
VSEGMAKCEGPFCDEVFAKSAMKFRPKRYCSNECKVIAWAFRKLKDRLNVSSDAEIVTVVRAR